MWMMGGVVQLVSTWMMGCRRTGAIHEVDDGTKVFITRISDMNQTMIKEEMTQIEFEQAKTTLLKLFEDIEKKILSTANLLGQMSKKQLTEIKRMFPHIRGDWIERLAKYGKGTVGSNRFSVQP